MAAERIVITGVGVVSAAGVGVAAFWERLLGSADRPARLGIDPDALAPHLPPRGTSHWGRGAKFAAVASSLAIAQSGVTLSEDSAAGVVLGTSMGSVEPIERFEEEAATLGPRLVNPMLFASTVHNSPAGLVGILHRLTSLNATLSAGSASTLDAVQYAVDAFRTGRFDVLLAGGLEGHAGTTEAEARAAGLLAEGPDGSTPFSRASDGLVLGEGAAVFVLEREACAAERGAAPLAGAADAAFEVVLPGASPDDAVAARVRVMREALAAAGVRPDEIGYVEASASGLPDVDALEAAAVRVVLGGTVPRVAAVKAQLGECFGASDAFELARAVGALTEGVVPPAAVAPGGRSMIEGLVGAPRRASFDHVLVNAFNPIGPVASLVVSRPGAWRRP